MKKYNLIPRAVAFAMVVVLSLASASLQAQTAAPDIPHVISYQGLLQSSSGQTVEGLKSIQTTLYSDAAGTKPVWQDEFKATVTQGTFDLALGSQKSLPDVSGSLWLGVKVGDDPEMRPLQQLSSAPYAMTVANGAITADKMGTDYVSSVSINGEKVTTRGSALNLVSGDGISFSYDPYSSTVAMRSVASAPEKGAKSQNQNSDLDMNGHNILNAPIIMSGAASSTTGSFRLYNSSNSYYSTIQTAALSASRTYTIPDAGGTANFVMTAGAQTVGGLKTFSAGATLGNVLDMSSYRITNVATPTSSSDASTKGYVDAINSTLTSAINTEISDRQSAVSAEASARTSADNTLTSSISSEVTRAQGAESTLTSNLNSEITNRQTAVASEASARTSSDNALSASISAEATRAQGAESTLTSNLNSEITNRQAAVTSEASARTSADNTLTSNLSAETLNRQSAVATEASARTTADNALTASIAGETSRAQGAEGTLTNNLNSEITNRTAAVAAEAITRAGAVSTLTTNLNAEVSNRQAAVTSEANTRAAAVATLNGSLSNEVARATTEENSLQSQIDGISLPQDLSTTAAPTFDGLTITGGSPIYDYGLFGQFAPSYFFGDLSIYANIVMAGTIDAGFQSIIDVPDPTNAQDAANKNYVDVLTDQINAAISTHSDSITQIDNAISAMNPLSVDRSGAANGTYTAYSASITGNTTNVVNLVGCSGAASGSDDQNTGVQGTASGTSTATTIGGDFTATNNSSSGTAIGGRFSASGAASNIAVQATSGSIQVQTAGEGIILKSPNGTCYKLTVSNTGVLTTTAIACP